MAPDDECQALDGENDLPEGKHEPHSSQGDPFLDKSVNYRFKLLVFFCFAAKSGSSEDFTTVGKYAESIERDDINPHRASTKAS